ncbi:ABC-type multidrug transport system, ATPase component [Thermoplasmatales archaeon BRNA1]|nr:ABC-type multidrug transport system, ATPase component [Thermoplasmatales archaeon BRNA1]
MAGEDIIEIEGLVKRYKNKTAINNITMTVKKGEMYAFLGPNGAGKTTTVRVLSTLTNFDEGKVIIDGYDLLKNPKEAKSCMGVIQQHISLDKDLTVWENMMAHAMYQQIPKAERKKRIDELSEYIGLGEYYNYKVDKLSGGWKKRVAIVCALVHRPKLLFLDEPTVGLDIQARRGLWDLLRKLNDDGMTIFLTTHYIEEAESLCHHVGFIDKGTIIAEGTPDELASKVGNTTVEYYGPDRKTQYRYFASRDEATEFSKTLGPEFTVTVRKTNLEDAFVEMTGNKIGDNGFMTMDGKSEGKKMGGMA